MHHYFAAVLRRITQFAQKCSAKITVCQSEQTFCQWVKYTLINSRNWTHVICEVTCFQPVTGENRLLFPTSLSSQTGYLTHLIWISWITQFGVLFSSRYIVRRAKTLTTRNKSWTVAATWSAKNESMLLLTSGLNVWSFVLTVDTMSIVCVSSVTFACCKLIFCHESVENVAGVDVFWLLQLPADVAYMYKEYLIIIFKFCPCLY